MSGIARALVEALGEGVVAVGEAVPERNRQDWSTVVPVTPLALVRPRTTAEVAAAVRLCHAHKVAVVPQGGLTGLCGGAAPTADAVAISLERMRGVEAIDEAAGTMVVLAGTPLETVQAAADEAGFLCPLDLGARGSCSIGGNIATNAGGNRTVRYGMTRDMVLGLEVVLPDGTVLGAMNRLVKNNTGYDLKQLFIGAEGTLGIVTRAVLRLQPKPRFVTAAFCGLPDFASVVTLLKEARAGLGGTLAAFEVLWPAFYDLITTKAQAIRKPLTGRHERYVLLEIQGGDAEFEEPRLEAFLGRMLEQGVLEDAALARSTADVKAFWALRDAVAEFEVILGPVTGFDLSLPTAQMDELVAEAEAALEAEFPGKRMLAFGHVGDGNVHLVVHVPDVAAQPQKQVYALVYDLIRARRGSVSAEHGLGTLKRDYLAYVRTPEEIALMRTLKRAIDPLGLMNPGKVLAV